MRVQREVLRGTGWHLQKWPAFLLVGVLVGLLYMAMSLDTFYVYGADILSLIHISEPTRPY